MTPLLRAEVQKLTSTRLARWLLLGAAAITALYVSLQIAFTDDPDTWALPLDTLAGQRTLLASAASASAPLVAVLGAIGLGGEYRHRTASTTFLATPARGRVVAAKLLTYALVGVGFAVTCELVAIAIAWPWLAATGVTLQLTSADNLATIGGVVTAVALFGPLGVAIGALVRDQVAAVVGLLIYLFVVEPILTGIGALERWTAYLPGPARNAVTGTVLSTRDFLDAWQGGAILLAYVLVLAAAGWGVTVRRDVT